MIDEQPTITLAQPDPPSMVTTRPPEDAPPMQQPQKIINIEKKNK
jgi:hypothetical protein